MPKAKLKPTTSPKSVPSVTDSDWRPMRTVHQHRAESTGSDDLADQDINQAILDGVPLMHRSIATGKCMSVAIVTWRACYTSKRGHVYPRRPEDETDIERLLLSSLAPFNPLSADDIEEMRPDMESIPRGAKLTDSPAPVPDDPVEGIFYLYGPALDATWLAQPNEEPEQAAQGEGRQPREVIEAEEWITFLFPNGVEYPPISDRELVWIVERINERAPSRSTFARARKRMAQKAQE